MGAKDSAGGARPLEDAAGTLDDLPVAMCFQPVVAATERRKVGLLGLAARPRDRVIEVAAGGNPPAAREPAGLIAQLNGSSHHASRPVGALPDFQQVTVSRIHEQPPPGGIGSELTSVVRGDRTDADQLPWLL